MTKAATAMDDGHDDAPKVSVVDSLRNSIVQGLLTPGQRLKAATLAKEHNTSLTVLREALNRLSGEHLVDFEPQVGFSVRKLSIDDLIDLVDQRILLESIALRRCMKAGDVAWQAEVLAAHHRLTRTPIYGPMAGAADGPRLNPQWSVRHTEFHNTVLEDCGSPRLFRTIQQLAREADLYMHALLPYMEMRNSEMDDEHGALVKAIIDEDTERAVQLLTDHQLKTRDEMVTCLKTNAIPGLNAPSPR